MPKILVVDDRIEEAQPLLAALGKQGWVTVFSYDGQDAIAKVEATRFDAIICDLQMPDMGGYEVLAAVASKPSNRGIRFLLANSWWDNTNWSHIAGGRSADCHVTKPYTKSELNGIMRLLKRMFEYDATPGDSHRTDSPH
jgi:CheY-like chemotaxis protein